MDEQRNSQDSPEQKPQGEEPASPPAAPGTEPTVPISGWRPAAIPPQLPAGPPRPTSTAPTAQPYGGAPPTNPAGPPQGPPPPGPAAPPAWGAGLQPPGGPGGSGGIGGPVGGPPPPWPAGGYPRGPAAPPPPSYGSQGPPPGAYFTPMPPGPSYGPPPYPPGYGPGAPPGGWRPGPPFMPPRRRPGPLRILGIVVIVIVVIFIALNLLGSFISGPSLGLGDYVGILDVEGTIGDGSGYDTRAGELITTLKKWAKDSSIKGIVVRINSPGGTVAATQELHDQILQYRKTGRPVVCSMADVAASGGFYTAMACDEIYANPGSLTGSIGVILEFMNVEDLTNKVGVKFNVIKSGKFKDIGAYWRPMTEDEKKLLQGVIDDTYSQFLDAVTESRADAVREILAKKEDKKESDFSYDDLTTYVKQYADGRIFSGKQAEEFGFVDHLGSFQAAIQRVTIRANIQGEPKLITSRRPRGFLESLAGETSSLVRGMKPGQVSLEYRFVP